MSVLEKLQKDTVNKGLNTLDVALKQLNRGDVLKKHTEDLIKLKELARKITMENDPSGYRKLGLELLDEKEN